METNFGGLIGRIGGRVYDWILQVFMAMVELSGAVDQQTLSSHFSSPDTFRIDSISVGTHVTVMEKSVVHVEVIQI